ncbi:MAG: cytochrome P450 [Rhodanobacteraceae bacterium]|nr:cytochrome P450 [Rhodanobacteraceae bacterium]
MSNRLGVVKTPFLGLPLLKEIQADPLTAATRLQHQCGDVAEFEILFRRIVYFFSPEAVRKVLVDHHDDFERETRLLHIFESFQGRNVLTTEGADWERQRRLLTPAFSPKRMDGYMNLMQAAIDSCVSEELPTVPGQHPSVDVDAFTTRITMDVILRTLFSHASSREETRQASLAIRALSRQSMREVYWTFVPPGWLPYPGRAAKMRNLQSLRRLIAAHVDARLRHRSESRTEAPAVGDVLDMMLQAGDDDARLSTQEILDNCMLLFGAGFDTSASALTWWIGLMATHPEVMGELRREVDAACADRLDLAGMARLPFLNATIKEAMRIYPPSTALFTRVAKRDMAIAGTAVRKGTLVVAPIWQMHRNERYFANPETFAPRRFLPGAPAIPRGAFMPFGAGPRFCLGQQFASVEIALIAAHLVRHFELDLESGDELPQPFVDLALKPKTPMKVRFLRRDGARRAATRAVGI